MTLSYTKTKSGQWAVMGAVTEVECGPVSVTKRDGTVKSEVIASVGDTFVARYGDNKGKTCRYGYLAARASSKPKATRSRGRRSGCRCGSQMDEQGDIPYSSHNCDSCNFDAEHG